MLAIVFGCVKFHKLIYGKDDVVIESDHKPLETLLSKPMHNSPMRIQRMRLKLQPYTFRVVYVSGKKIGLADCLSRFPQQQTPTDEEMMDDELMVCVADTLSCKIHNRLQEATEQDENLQEVKRCVIHGWPSTRSECSNVISLYYEYQDEISTYNGVLYRGNRVIIPKSMRSEMLKLMHSSHMGIVKTKQLARDLIFWPGMSKEIEEMVKKCEICLQYQNKQPKEPMIIHEIPSLPWNKVATDLFELDGNYYIVMVDYYSNFIEVSPLPDTKTSTVLKVIKSNIARYGIMETLVSDNGPQFSSEEFREVMKKYNIEHITSSPLYPQSNGLAERSVQTVKKMIKKCKATGDDVYMALLDLNNTPRDETIGSPAQRLMGRRTKTRLPTTEVLLKPQNVEPEKVKQTIEGYRQTQKYYYDRGSKPQPEIEPTDAIRIFTKDGWKPAEYVKPNENPRSHVVKAGDEAREYRRNSSFLMRTGEKPHHIIPVPRPYIPSRLAQQRTIRNDARPSRPEQQKTIRNNARPSDPEQQRTINETPRPPETTRSGRIRKKPSYLKEYVQY